MDHEKLTDRYSGRGVRLTEVVGTTVRDIVAELFAAYTKNESCPRKSCPSK